jgi:hypothetical protein
LKWLPPIAVFRNRRSALAGLAAAPTGCIVQICGHGKKSCEITFPKTR